MKKILKFFVSLMAFFVIFPVYWLCKIVLKLSKFFGIKVYACNSYKKLKFWSKWKNLVQYLSAWNWMSIPLFEALLSIFFFPSVSDCESAILLVYINNR